MYESAGAVLGFANLAFEERPWGIACEVRTLVVASGARGRGIGRALMSACEEVARREGARGVRLDVLVGNDEGAAFYEKLGYDRFAWRYGRML